MNADKLFKILTVPVTSQPDILPVVILNELSLGIIGDSNELFIKSVTLLVFIIIIPVMADKHNLVRFPDESPAPTNVRVWYPMVEMV